MKAKTVRTIAGLTLGGVAFEALPHADQVECPTFEQAPIVCEMLVTEPPHFHTPHQDHETGNIPPFVSALGPPLSGDDPMTWQNSSTMDAAMIAIRHHKAVRDAQRRAAAMYCMNNAVVPASTDTTSSAL